jgi:DNA-binding transcriptional ArsR family regulator
VVAEVSGRHDGGMTSPAQLAGLAGLLADETRAAMCLALLDNRAWTAGELAKATGVAPSTATEHLNRLIGGGLLVEHRQGRHRYVRLAGSSVATLIEEMTAHVSEAPPPPARTLRAATASAALARGRTCYDHFAGRLGVAVTDAMAATGLLEQANGFALTDAGRAWLTGPIGIAEADLSGAKRPLVRECVDWTERRPHLAGLAGAQLCRQAFERGWVTRIGTGRAVKVTPAGERAFQEQLGIPPAVLD